MLILVKPITLMNKKSNNSRPDIDFEKELWDAANELRGAVAEESIQRFCPIPYLP